MSRSLGVGWRDQIERGRFAALSVAAAAVLWAAPMASGRVVGDILSVGLRSGPDASGGGSVIRAGAWVPIAVELGLENQASFEGFLQVRQCDSDGDYCYDEVPVYLRSDSGPKRFELYVVAAAMQQPGDLAVSVLDADKDIVQVVSGGELVRRLVFPLPPRVISDMDCLIAVITPEHRLMGRITRLVSPEQAERRRTEIHLSHLTPARLPSRWIGLEAADCIVWDEADATALTRSQIVALIEWVHHGGKLLLASAKTADSLANSELLAPLLPVEVGQVVTATDLPNLRDGLLGLTIEEIEKQEAYVTPIAVVRCALRKGVGVSSLVVEDLGGEGDSGKTSQLIAKRRVGQGEVIFVAAALRDLLNVKGSPAKFFAGLLSLRDAIPGAEEFVERTPLFPRVQETVGFAGTGGAYMVVAFLFALVYLGLSTFGVWGFLKSRGWTQHSWLAFAAVAVLASVVSVSAVQTIRGVGQKLQQLEIVTLEAGLPGAVATCYFGLKTGTHSAVDVWMPSAYPRETEPGESQCFLRPLVEWHEELGVAQTRYTDPSEYRLRPASAELAAVPVRATVKRFEGRWRGSLPGGVQASIRILRNQRLNESSLMGDDEDEVIADVFSEDSTITNNLGVDLETCYILQAEVDAFRLPRFLCMSPRGMQSSVVRNTYAHKIRGGIRDGETIRLRDRIHQDEYGRPVPAKEWTKRNTLYAAHSDWGRGFSSLGFPGRSQAGREFDVEEDYQDALLLATTLDEYHPATLKALYRGGVELLNERCRQLDLSDLLTTDTVILIGFAEAPGPVKLCTRRGGREYRPVTPSKALSMYRVVIPLRR